MPYSSQIAIFFSLGLILEFFLIIKHRLCIGYLKKLISVILLIIFINSLIIIYTTVETGLQSIKSLSPVPISFPRRSQVSLPRFAGALPTGLLRAAPGLFLLALLLLRLPLF